MVENDIDEADLFNAARKLGSREARRQYLQSACGNDAVRAKVLRLLSAYDEQPSFLAGPASGLVATVDPAPERTGTLIGPYKLLEQIGEGGMGVVYVAEQTEPVRRRVALKIIKPGMDTKQVIARFEAERQALAMMDHPNIAKIFDAGTVGQSTKSQASSIKQIRSTKPKAPNQAGSLVSDIRSSDLEIVCDLELGHCDLTAGRPYFVMELVRGLPITEYCDKAKLNPRERLVLFVDVCHAVQHAHQKGVIHRDLKPSNVMVTTNDGRPVVKVIDFGVAKAVGQQLTERTVYTALTQLVGTPLYMSPEQAELTSHDVDTRSDVYSLGVLLYELLTGQTPFDKERLKNVNFDEMRRIIREDEPPRPSHRVSTLSAQASSTISQQRGLDERHLGRVLRGELDWIVMKALEKDRSRRYESASAFAADIQRYLSDEPVLACPPTTMYRFQKFARKHRPALVTAAAIALCLILGTTVSAWQAVRATTAEAQANANEAQAKEAAAAEAQQRQRAEANEQQVTAQRDEAQRQRDEVKTLYHKLATKEQQLQRTLYAAHMNLARHAWEEAGVARVLELLDQQRPKPGELDLRGFEWHYLQRLCHSELLTLKGHTGEVTCVAYSLDGKRLASGSADNTIKVWDSQTGQELLTITGQNSEVNSVAFSPDGKRLASGCGFLRTPGRPLPSVKVWDAETGKELLTIKSGHDYVAFSPDGKRLAGGAYDETVKEYRIKVWDAQTGQELLSIKGNDYRVIFSPDGTRLAGSRKVWDAQTGQELVSLMGHTSGDNNISYSPDGKRLARASTRDGTVNVWDAETGQELLALKHLRADSTAFSTDGKWLASGSWLGTIRIWDLQTGQEIRTLTGGVGGIVFSPDGLRLASIGADKTVKIWDAQKDQENITLPEAGGEIVVFSPDWRRLASATKDNTVKIRDAQSGRLILNLEGHKVPVQGLAFSPDGKRLASSGGGRRLPDGGTSGTSTDPSEVKVWDAETGQELLAIKGLVGGSIRSVAFSPDGKRLASRAGVGYLKVWDAENGRELLSLKGGGFSTGVAFSPDGTRLASAGREGVKMWDAQTGQELLIIPRDWATSVAFSPDGNRLATLSQRHDMMQVWNAQNGQELLSLKGHTGKVFSLAYSPDGKRLASASNDYTVKVWDAQTGQELFTLRGGGFGVAFSPDGNRLASDWGSKVTIWDATPLPEKP